MVLVWIVVSRGQCVAVGFIKAERRRGRDLRKSLATVCSEVEGGLPGPAVVGGLLHHKLTGTRALWRGGAPMKISSSVLIPELYTESQLLKVSNREDAGVQSDSAHKYVFLP